MNTTNGGAQVVHGETEEMAEAGATSTSPRDGSYRIVEGEHHDRIYMIEGRLGDLSHAESVRLWSMQQVTALKSILMLRGDGQNEDEMDTIIAMAARIESFILDGVDR